jgi:hypothetical protein
MLENGCSFDTVDGFRGSQNPFGHGRCHSISFAHDRNYSGRDVPTPHRYIASITCGTQLTNGLVDGRVYFTAPKLFEASLCLRGAQRDDGWFFVHVEFLINIGGGLSGLQGGLTQSTTQFLAELLADIPRVPTGIMARHITNEADARLGHYLPLVEDTSHPGAEVAPRPQLPEGVIDTPLVRLYNFLRTPLNFFELHWEFIVS